MLQQRWIWLTFAAVLLTQGGVAAVRALYEPHAIRAPNRDLVQLPLSLGDWTAAESQLEDSGIDRKLFVAIGADQALSRVYTDDEGRTCTVHLALWHNSDVWVPHPPAACYVGNGYESLKQKRLELPNVPSGRVRADTFQHPVNGVAVIALYWYQMGTRTYVDRDSSRSVRQSFWGRGHRPPLVKALLQIEDREDNDDQAALLELAARIHEFVADL